MCTPPSSRSLRVRHRLRYILWTRALDMCKSQKKHQAEAQDQVGGKTEPQSQRRHCRKTEEQRRMLLSACSARGRENRHRTRALPPRADLCAGRSLLCAPVGHTAERTRPRCATGASEAPFAMSISEAMATLRADSTGRAARSAAAAERSREAQAMVSAAQGQRAQFERRGARMAPWPKRR